LLAASNLAAKSVHIQKNKLAKEKQQRKIEAIMSITFLIINHILHASKEPEHSLGKGPSVSIVAGHQS
jgi:hypothetical protein